MEMIKFILAIKANAIYGEGESVNSIRFEENVFYQKAIYEFAPIQIRLQEEGFTHWITKKKVKVNEGWITQRTVGAINRIEMSETLGLPYSYKEENETMANRANEILEKEGMITRVR